jgi:hypothetical protein
MITPVRLSRTGVTPRRGLLLPMARKTKIPTIESHPPQALNGGRWKWADGEAVIREGVPPPEKRTFQKDLSWLLEHVLKPGLSLDIGRSYDTTKNEVNRWRKSQGLPRGIFRVRPLLTTDGKIRSGWARVWRVK